MPNMYLKDPDFNQGLISGLLLGVGLGLFAILWYMDSPLVWGAILFIVLGGLLTLSCWYELWQVSRRSPQRRIHTDWE